MKNVPSIFSKFNKLYKTFFVRFCTPPEVKFDIFGTSKHGEGKLLLKKCYNKIAIV